MFNGYSNFGRDCALNLRREDKDFPDLNVFRLEKRFDLFRCRGPLFEPENSQFPIIFLLFGNSLQNRRLASPGHWDNFLSLSFADNPIVLV